ncbi:MAG: stimulus-sensing domain-containing protein [Alphaproteobacteria bacterium]|nr:stimulus-sensing domain-containing protein [Alphaproteobacteria bacterium]
MDLYWGGPERRITGLTLRIIAVNATALVTLLFGIIYLGQYQNALIEAKLATFKTEVELVAGALAEGAFFRAQPGSSQSPSLDPALVAPMIWRLSRTMDQRIYVFGADGRIMADSEKLEGYKDFQTFTLPEDQPLYTVQVLKNIAKFILKQLPQRRVLPPYPQIESGNAADYTDADEAMNGSISMSAWHNQGEDVVLSAAAPLLHDGTLVGAVLLVREARDIGRDIGELWLKIVAVFLITLIITILLSIYLSGTIAQPLRKLAIAAEAMRLGKSRDTEIPDLSHRNDEIGELSIVLREMTRALWERMDSIDNFAADVSHELKNPLTSLRSAVETVALVKKDKDREKLMAIIQHDIERMDRLISDISNASRIDAELSREALRPVNLTAVLRIIADAWSNSLLQEKAQHKIHVEIKNPTAADIFVWGLEGRLSQVFENLLSNAASFSPPGGSVTISLRRERKDVMVIVEDQGPGIPENKLETIFERFYTERPEHEDYGKHSGLGLAICRQIINAFGGSIIAENAQDKAGRITGARFTVTIKAV